MPQKLRCEVTRILDHGERVYSLFLKPEVLTPHFRSGQFLHLALDEYRPGNFWPDSRPFSIASAPSEREQLRITYAVKGLFTGRMEKELHEGNVVWIKMPYGDFAVSDAGAVCLLAGGTGVTAFTAFLADLPAGERHPVYLFYGARLPRLLIYRPLVEAIRHRCPELVVQYFAEHESERNDCLSGRLDLGVVWDRLPDPQALPYYLSGPPEMLQALRRGLGKRGIEPGRIWIDAWE
jgi:ferredoxin-NADP reductase